VSVKFQDYYEILGVGRDAKEKEIKIAYRKLARQWHPDLRTEKEKAGAEEKFKKINEAYEVLSDSEKRAKYDRLGANWRNGENFRPPPDMEGFHFHANAGGDAGGFSDFFETLFGGGPFGRSGRTGRRGQMRGQDVESQMVLTLEEVYRGGEKTLQLSSREACTGCGGEGYVNNAFCSRCGGTGLSSSTKTITVKIPSGIRNNSQIRLKGQGGEGIGGGPRGDLYLKVQLVPHPVFRVLGSDLEEDIQIMPDQAVMGDQVTVATLDGPVNMKVPPGTGAGRRFRLRGKGLPAKDGRGDLYVQVRIDIPRDLTDKEQDLYRQLAELRKGVSGK